MSTETRENLLRAATQVFAEKGFSGARVDEIAARAKANKAMIYYHFGPKEELYEATLVRLFGHVLQAVDAVESEVEDPRERLSAFYGRLARLFMRDPALPSIMMREALEATVEHVFAVLKLHRIQANYVPHNARSGRLLERLGFVNEGLAKDYLFIDGAWRDHVLTARFNPAFDASIFSSRRFRPA